MARPDLDLRDLDPRDLDVRAAAEGIQGAARDAASHTSKALAPAVRRVVHAVMALPLLVGRLGTILGGLGVRLSTLLGTTSGWLSQGSERARDAVDRARAVDLRELTFEPPHVRTKAQVRRERGRRVGRYALVAGTAAGIGAALAAIARRRREQADLAEEALWAEATTDPQALEGEAPTTDEVIDVAAAER